MSLRVAVQMDPLEHININGDSSLHLMLAAQARGYTLCHYDVRTLALDEGPADRLGRAGDGAAVSPAITSRWASTARSIWSRTSTSS